MVTSENRRFMKLTKGITNCYKLYLNQVIAADEAAYTLSMLELMQSIALPRQALISDSSDQQFIVMRLTHLGFSLLLISNAANVLAAPGGHHSDEREFVRVSQLQSFALDRSAPVGMQQGQQQGEPHRARFIGLPETSGYSASGDSNSPDNLRRQGKLSPEERRALRRQIDEAGHDLYSPKR